MSKMNFKYSVVFTAIRSKLRHEISYIESLGVGILSGHTSVVDSNGRLETIPLDIMCTPVNLKTMWKACAAPVGIVFREMMDDWYAVLPCDDTLAKWEIRKIPGRGHDMHRGRALAERAIQCDFDLPNASVQYNIDL
jgi:hypothetical protein